MRWRDRLAGLLLLGGVIGGQLAIPRRIVCIALLGVPHVCWSPVKLSAKSRPVPTRDVLISDISVKRRVFTSVQEARHSIQRQDDRIMTRPCRNFVRHFIVGNKFTISKNHRSSWFVTETGFSPGLNEFDANVCLDISGWRFPNIHEVNGESDWLFRAKSNGGGGCPSNDPCSLLVMRNSDTRIQRFPALNLTRGSIFLGFDDAILRSFGGNGSRIRASNSGPCLTQHDQIRHSTREKQEAGEQNHQTIKSELSTLVFSFFFLLFTLMAFYFIKSSIKPEGFINPWRMMFGVLWFLGGQCIGYLEIGRAHV